ncbi:hypothetical protein JW992_03120, partial [candidate division KSB1 bacterium]|nr:hypothetical protein [candidate division KSB1 bacterium]
MSRSKTSASASDLEAYLTDHILAYSDRQHEFWKRRYDSEAVFIESVAGARLCWERMIAPIQTFDREPLCVVQQRRNNEWLVELRHDERLLMQARLLVPETETNDIPPPLVICLHGIGGSAAMVLGEDDTHPPAYHAFGHALLDTGCAVLVPSLINAFAPRARVNRLAL